MLPKIEVETLDNGLMIAVLETNAPLVATVLGYRTGSRCDPPHLGGTAHFLEHMMFKGSRGYGAGEIDRLTRSLGGSNNAFTSHDLTVYYFTFAADRWTLALDVERDRMASLTLDPREMESERRVIAEEIAMYESDPWDALDQAVATRFFRGHPYGRPVLGSRRELDRIEAPALAEFHRCWYRPENAVLVLAGGVGSGARQRAAEVFLDAAPGEIRRRPRAKAPASGRPSVQPERLERRAGEVARMILSLPAPAACALDHPRLRLLATILGSGRASRLQRALVEEGKLCLGVSVDLRESPDSSVLSFALEALPGVEPERVEEALLKELRRIRETAPDAEEIARARTILLADWIFDHETIHHQALFAATNLALFDAEHPWRHLDVMMTTTRAELAKVADSYLLPAAGAVLGWSLPARRDGP